MFGIPRVPFWLGMAGLIPFLFGTVLALTPDAGGRQVLGAYGSVILSFMSGVLWGFATRAPARDRLWAYGFSVLPALYVFFMVQDSKLGLGLYGLRPVEALAYGFAGILVLDLLYQLRGLAPGWWMRLRLLITAVVEACLIVTVVWGFHA